MSNSVLVLGGSGAMGSAVVELFKAQGWNTVSVDFKENPVAAVNIIITNSEESEIKRIIADIPSVNCVVCAAGGWSSGGITSEDFFGSVKKMMDYNLSSAIAAAYIAGQRIQANGLVVLTGAVSALTPTPGMIGYGLSKVATHHLIKSLADSSSGLPEGTSTLGVLPITLDTPSNRSGMPGSNFDDWTPCSEVAAKILEWTQVSARPANGSMLSVATKAKVSTWNIVN
eukprot:gene5718-6611_t